MARGTSQSPSCRSVAIAGAFVACVGLFERTATAEPPPTPGEKLFREGRDAMDRKDWPAACSKFEESYKLEHVVTSLLNQADCEEKRGRLATSLALWQSGLKKVDDPATKTYAEKRTSALLPRVPTLTVHLGSKSLQGVVATVDGTAITIDTPVPLDPGDHVLEAKASVGEAETRKVAVEEGRNQEVTVLLAAASQPAPPSTLKPDESDKARRMKTAGYAVGAVGIAGLGVFAVTGIIVLADHKDCPHFTCAPNKRPQALLGANVAGLVIGVAGLGVGIPLIVVGSQKEKAKEGQPAAPAKAELRVGPTYGGALGSLTGTF